MTPTMTMKKPGIKPLQTAFPARARRLAEVAAGIAPDQDLPLLKAAALGYVTLATFYPDRPIPMSPDMLGEQAALIAGLPNITPNGIVLPKRETYLAYNMIHAEVVKIFEAAGLDRHVETIFAPINVRLVNGTPNPNIDRRPRSSTKFHSDMWAGEPADAILVFLPVLGDAENVGIRWIEPTAIPNRFRGPLDDFDEGKHLIEGGTDYRACFRNGDIVLTDPYLIHATQKTLDSDRISIDFRFIAREKSPEDADTLGERRQNYLSYDVWREIGRGRVLTTPAPLEPYNGPDHATRNEYAAKYEIVELDA